MIVGESIVCSDNIHLAARDGFGRECDIVDFAGRTKRVQKHLYIVHQSSGILSSVTSTPTDRRHQVRIHLIRLPLIHHLLSHSLLIHRVHPLVHHSLIYQCHLIPRRQVQIPLIHLHPAIHTRLIQIHPIHHPLVHYLSNVLPPNVLLQHHQILQIDSA